jgi:signal transduction histidine kinase
MTLTSLPDRRPRPRQAAIVLEALVSTCLVVAIGRWAVGHPASLLKPEVLFWALGVATVDLLAVPVSTALQLSLSFPVLLGVAILYAPPVAAAVALVGSSDAREMRREISPFTAFFNRSQIALAVLVQSAVIHALAGGAHSPLYKLLPSVLLAYVAAYSVNVSLVALDMHLRHSMTIRAVVAQMRLGELRQFLLNLVGLCLIGLVIARLYVAVQFWAVAVFIGPLIFARQMFFRNMELEEAHKELEGKNIELKDRARVLRALSNRIADERKEERVQIADYIHDDAAQMLYRLSLQIEMAKRRLGKGDVETVKRNLEEIDETRKGTDQALRGLIRDLHRSPIGRGGLAEAITSYAEDASRGLDLTITVDVGDVSLPSAIQLLVYQITREAVMNAIKHAEAENIWVSLAERDDVVELMIKDDGRGFDTSEASPEGHFGSIMMRERALVTGGTFSRESQPGHGATIRATFPHVWVEEELLEPSPGSPVSGAPTGEPAVGPAWGNAHDEAKDREPVHTEDLGPIAAPPAKEPSEAGRPTRSGTRRPPPDDQPRQIPAW